MRIYGNATTSVGGRTSVPLPTTPPKIGRRPELVDCGRGHRIRPGAFHICLDLSEPEPPPPPARPKREPKPRDRREDALCAAGCGEKVYREGNRCRACSAAARVKPKPPPKPPRVKKEQPTCRNDGCDRPVAKDGNRCRPCYLATTAAAQKRELVGRGLGGGIGNNGGKVNARIDEVKERYLAGESVKVLAADVGVTTAGIRQALKRNGVTLRSQAQEQTGRLRPDKRALTPEQAALAVARYRMGASVVGIAGRMGVGQTTVRRALAEAGVKPHGRRGGAS